MFSLSEKVKLARVAVTPRGNSVKSRVNAFLALANFLHEAGFVESAHLLSNAAWAVNSGSSFSHEAHCVINEFINCRY